MSTDDTPQIPVDAPQADERVDIVSPVDEPEPAPAFDGAAVEAGGSERPEVAVIGAFAGAFLFAKLLKRIGGG